MRLAAVAMAAVLLMPACGSALTESPIRVFAAASLQDVLPALSDAFVRAGGRRVQAAFDASSRLRVQIEQGASVDLFLSADDQNVDLLAAAGLAGGTARAFAANRIVLVVPARTDRPPVVHAWIDLAHDGVRIVAAGPDVPVARYADELVAQLASAAGAPSPFAAEYADNIVSHEDNVRAILAKVEIGEADAAFVYATDAAASQGVRLIPLPDGVDVVTEYRGVVLADAAAAAAAGDFLAWLAGTQAQAILAAHDFAPLP